jgi:hypothetical protein
MKNQFTSTCMGSSTHTLYSEAGLAKTLCIMKEQHMLIRQMVPE